MDYVGALREMKKMSQSYHTKSIWCYRCNHNWYVGRWFCLFCSPIYPYHSAWLMLIIVLNKYLLNKFNVLFGFYKKFLVLPLFIGIICIWLVLFYYLLLSVLYKWGIRVWENNTKWPILSLFSSAPTLSTNYHSLLSLVDRADFLWNILWKKINIDHYEQVW